MTVNLNASLTQGFGITSDTSGVLTFQSNAAETMRIDTSGNVGIGTTTPIDKLTVNGSISTNSSQSYIYSNGGSGTSVNSGFFLDGSGSTLRMFTGNSERMRIDSSGNVGIGTSSPGAQLQLTKSGTSDYTTFRLTNSGASGRTYEIGLGGNAAAAGYANNLYFYDSTASALRMVLDSSGNLLVGTTNASSSAGNGVKILPRGNVSVVNDGSTGGGDGFDFYNSTAAAYRFYVTGAGVINATSTTITAISDQRLKENIQDIDVGLNAIMALKPRKFDWKAGKGKDKKGDRGWIAQEFEQVFPDMISTWKDEPPEGEEPYKAVNADLIPVLVKAIQELSTKVDAQASEIAALKAKVGA